MQETRKKRPLHSPPSSPPRAIPLAAEYEDADIFTGLSFYDDSLQELDTLFDAPPEIPPFKVKFIAYPYSLPSDLVTSSSYVTINGNEETCGSSFSDSDCSFMASVDPGSANAVYPPGLEGGAWGSEEEMARGWILEDSECTDEFLELNDVVWAEFLGEGDS